MSLVKEGYILKQGEKFAGWKKRYLKLYEDRNQLRFDYYKTPSSELQGSFGLSAASQFRIISPPLSSLPVTTMEITTPFRVYLISAESEVDVQDWVWVIQKLQAHIAQVAQSDFRPRAQSESAGFRAGYLYKKGAKRRNWKRRWFVLAGKMLRYYPSSEKMKEPLGEIDLAHAVDVHREYVSDGPGDQRFMFSIETPSQGRTYYIAAHNEPELEGWLRTLGRAGVVVHSTPRDRNSRFYSPGSAVSAVKKEAWPFLAPAGLAMRFEELHRLFRPVVAA